MRLHWKQYILSTERVSTRLAAHPTGHYVAMRLPLTLALALCLVATSAGAVVYVDCSAPGTVHNGASWGTAFLSISQALQSIGNGGEIWVKAGAYRERLTLNTYTTIYGGFLGFETSTSQRLLGAFPTVISGQRGGRVISMPNAARATLDGLTIRDGLSDRGGGIRCSTNSIANIRNCRIESCEATVFGGGVYYDTYTQGTMSDCVVANNYAPCGAGVVVEYHSYPTLQNDVIVRNHATTSGGGVYCPFHSGALLVNCTIAYNRADVNGGGIYAYYGGPETFRYCIIAFNTAPTGAGLYADGGSSSATLTGCDWYGNCVGNLGGWLSNLPVGNLTSDPMFLMPEHDEFHLKIGSPCAGIGAYPLESTYAIDRIGVAKLQPDGTSLKLTNKVVSAVDGDVVYLQEPNRSAAIAVKGLTGCSPDKIMTSVAGTLSTTGASRILTATSSTICSASSNPKPIAVRIGSLHELTGVYVLIWGHIDSLTADGFILSDGQSCVSVHSSATGLRPGDCVTLTGVHTLDGYFRCLSNLTVQARPD